MHATECRLLLEKPKNRLLIDLRIRVIIAVCGDSICAEGSRLKLPRLFLNPHTKTERARMVDPMLSVDEIPRNASIFIYGTGSVGVLISDVIEKSRADVNIAFLDTFRGGAMGNRAVLQFDEFLKDATRNERIVIASSFWPEISRNLSEAGFKHVTQAFDFFEFVRDTGLLIRLTSE